MKSILRNKAICGSRLFTLTGSLVLLLIAGLQKSYAQTGYLYVHAKAISEDIHQSFNFSVSGGSTQVPSFNLEDQQLNIEPTDIGAGHGTGGGELWIVAGATKGANGNVYHRAANSTTWNMLNGQQGSSIDGADLGHFVMVNTNGDAFVYDGSNYTKILDHGSNNIKAVDIACNGSIADGTGFVAVVDDAGHVWKYTGDFSNNNNTWSDITPLDFSGSKFTRLDINTTNNDIVLIDAVSCVTKINAAGGGLLYYAKALGIASLAADVTIDDNGVVYAISKDLAGMDAVYRNSGSTLLTWVEEPQTGLHYVLTTGDANQVWLIKGFTAAQQSSFSNQSTIYTRVGDGSGSWIDDERVQTTQNDNAIMIPVAAGTYTITEANTAGWNLQKLDVYDPSSGSNVNVANNTVTVVVAAGQVAHVLFTNGIISPTAMSVVAGASTLITNFGSGAPNTRGAPLTGFTDFHFYSDISKNTTPDGYYSLTQNSQGGWGNSTLTDHTGLPGGYFMMVNASYAPNVFYKQRVTGLIPGHIYMLSFWTANLSPSSPLQPMILAGLADTSTGLSLGSISTGSLVKDNNWHQYVYSFLALTTTGDLFLQNNALGGFGNDLAIDDISLSSFSTLLPVNIISFAAQKENQDVVLNWSGTAQLNFDYYGLERSADGTHWKSIAQVNATNTGAAVQDYTYTDQAPLSGTNYYRLKEVDLNGDAKYSETKTAVFAGASGKTLSTWPNPFVSSLQVQAPADKNQAATIRMINADGQVVFSKNVQLTQGQNNFTVDGLGNQAKGMYLFELQSGNTVTREKMMKQ